jgi:lipid A 3-O-deacylase
MKKQARPHTGHADAACRMEKRMNPIVTFLMSAVLLTGALHAGVVSTAKPWKPVGPENGTWRFEFDNDIFFNSDNGFTAGMALQLHSAAATDWSRLVRVPGFVRHLGRAFLKPARVGEVCRFGMAVGQVVQTPDDLIRRDLIVEDVPYAGALTLQASWYVYSDVGFRGFELTTGVTGPLSLAEGAQKGFHRMIDCVVPQGWDNQLASEAVLNVSVARKRKFWRGGSRSGLSGDAGISGTVALGNLFTHASAALELRGGLNMPGGFVYVPDPIGFDMHHVAVLRQARPSAASLYASLVVRGTALARTFFLDGNTFCDSHRVDRKYLIGQIAAGLHFVYGHIGLSLNAVSTTPVVDTRKATAAEAREQFGSIEIEWRF